MVLVSDQSKMYELQQQQAIEKYTKSVRLFGFSGAFTAVFVLYITYSYNINLSPNITANDLIDFSSKLKFLFQYLTLGLTWLLLSVYFVVKVRVFSIAMNPMFGYEHLTQAAKNNLTNSLEQFLLSSVSQLILITYIDSTVIIKLIPVINLLFFIGRIAFWFGYPQYRAFGFSLTLIPNSLMVCFNLFKFIKMYTNF